MRRPRHGCKAAAIGALAATTSVGAIADAPPSATAGDFTAIQTTTTSPHDLVALWNKPGSGVALRTERQTTPGKPISTFIIFKGCRPDPAGLCNVTASLQLVGPSGSNLGPAASLGVWVKRPPLPRHEFALSSAVYTVGFDAADALGTYILRSDVTDQVAGVTVHIEGPITLQK